jgi:hypothetical protein
MKKEKEEGQQLFNEDDDDGVGFVAERGIDDERDVDTDTDAGDMDVAVDIVPGEFLLVLRTSKPLHNETDRCFKA